MVAIMATIMARMAIMVMVAMAMARRAALD